MIIDINKLDQRILELTQKLDDYLEIQEYINNDKPIEKIDIGAKTFLDVELCNPKKIIMNVGLGICVDMEFKEAEQVIQLQAFHIGDKIKQLITKRNEIL